MPISIYKADITKAHSQTILLKYLQIHTLKRTVKCNNGIRIYNSKLKTDFEPITIKLNNPALYREKLKIN